MITRQEMFNRAWLGLRDQQWLKAVDALGCVYQSTDGCRCAWGHVDPTLSADTRGSVEDLHTHGIGIAGRLPVTDRYFALDLQLAHDRSMSADDMRNRMCAFAIRYNLTVPSEDS